MPVWEWQAWSWRCSTDEGGLRGVQRLIAVVVAAICSSPEKPLDWREVAHWLAPRHATLAEERFRRQVRRRAPALLRFRGRRLREEFAALNED